MLAGIAPGEGSPYNGVYGEARRGHLFQVSDTFHELKYMKRSVNLLYKRVRG